VSESRFTNIEPEMPLELPINITGSYILFRGKINDEAGIDEIIRYFLLEKNLDLVIASPDLQAGNLYAENIYLLNRYLSDGEIKWLYSNAYICLGQFGTTKRQQRSIPHKFFEASYFGCPYVSAPSNVFSEYGISSGVIQINSIHELKDILGKINQIPNKKELILNNYQEFLSNQKLVSDFETVLSF